MDFKRVVNPGTDRGAMINQALRAAELRYRSTGRKQDVELAAGVHYIETAIIARSGVRLRGQGDNTVLVPTFTGAADDPANAVIKVVGELVTATMSTTLTAVKSKGATSYAVANAGSIQAGGYFVVEGTNVEGEDGSGHSGGALAEVLRVASSYSAGLTLPLAWASYQHHGTTGITVKAVTPVVGFEVHDLCIQGSEDDVTTAAGVYALYAVDLVVNGVTGEGFARAAIDVESSKGFESKRYRSRGNQNAWYFLSSVCDFDVCDFDGEEGVTRVHASGLPRAQIYLRRRCTDGRVHDGRLAGGFAGFFHAGGHNLTFDNIHIRNQEITQAIYDRAVAGGEFQDGGTWALGWGSGHGPLPLAEYAFGATYSNITTEDLVAPDATGWNDVAPRRAVSAYIHDTLRIAATNITCMQFDPTPPVSGVVLSDVDGALTNLMVKGCTFGLTCENFYDDVKVSRYRYDAVRGMAPNAAIPLYLDYDPTSNRGPNFDGVHVTNAFSFVWFGGEFVFDPHFEIRNLITDAGVWDYVILANNQTGVAFTVGDVVELDSGYVGSDRRIKTPDTGGTDYASRLAVCASGLADDAGTSYLLIAPLPQKRASVKAGEAAIAYGDRIGYEATRRAAAEAGALQPIGKALSRKAAGAEGMIVIGSVA